MFGIRTIAVGSVISLVTASLVGAATSANAVEWSSAAQISADASSTVQAQGAPVFAQSADGMTVTAVWRSDNATSQGVILANRSTDAGVTWQANPTQISDEASATVKAQTPVISASSDGDTVTVAWASRSGEFGEIYANRYVDGSWSGSPALLSNPADTNSRAGDPILIGSASGSAATVVWRTQVGASLGQIESNGFTDGAWANGPTLISLSTGGGANSTDVRAVGSTDGSVVTAVWRTISGGLGAVYANRFSASAWGGSPDLISAAAASTANAQSAPAIVTNPSGAQVAVAWQSGVSGNGQIVSSAFASGAWSGPELVSSAAASAANASAPKLVASTDLSSVTAVWQSRNVANGEVYAGRRTAGTWAANPTLISVAAASSTNVQSLGQVASNPAGDTVTVVWRSYDQFNGEIYANRFSSNSWASATRLSNAAASNFQADEPQLSTSVDGSIATVAWSSNTQSFNREVYANRFDGTWSGVELISAPASSNARASSVAPGIVTTADGESTSVVWKSANSSFQGSVLSSEFSGSQWSDPVQISSPPSAAANALDPVTSMNTAKDRVIVGWPAQNASNQSAVFAAAVLTTQSLTFGSAPEVTVGGTGTVNAESNAPNATVVYTSDDPTACTVDGNTVTGLVAGTGNCTITANSAAVGAYSAAEPQSQTFSIAMAPPTPAIGVELGCLPAQVIPGERVTACVNIVDGQDGRSDVHTGIGPRSASTGSGTATVMLNGQPVCSATISSGRGRCRVLISQKGNLRFTASFDGVVDGVTVAAASGRAGSQMVSSRSIAIHKAKRRVVGCRVHLNVAGLNETPGQVVRVQFKAAGASKWRQATKAKVKKNQRWAASVRMTVKPKLVRASNGSATTKPFKVTARTASIRAC